MNTLTLHHKYVCDVQFLQNPCKSTPPKACRQASPTLLSLEWRAVHMWERKELLHWRKPVKCRNTTHILLCMKLKGTIGFGQFQWTLSGTSLGKKYLGHTHKLKYQNDSFVYLLNNGFCVAQHYGMEICRPCTKNVCEKDKKGAN